MSALDIFTYSGQQVRTVVIDGEPWFVAADVATILGYRMASDLTRSLDDDEKGTHETRTPSGDQHVSVITEAGLFKALVQRQTGRMADERVKQFVKDFQRWVTHEVLPSIRRTGSYAAPVQAEVSRRDLALAILAAEDEADRQRARAEVAEQFRDAIERNEGLVPRAFHKHYFPDVTDKAFFDLLYSRGLLINQRGKGTRRQDGTYRDGPQHGHPGYQGKKFFYLDSGVNQKTGYRFDQTRVRPGDPEIELVQYLTKLGLTPQTTSKELAHV